MNIVFDSERLLQLITSLHTLTGIRANIFDMDGKDICLNEGRAPFCELINASAEGHRRCEQCDRDAVSRCGMQEKPYSYRCHAGICETILPICFGGSPAAYLVFGQMLDSTPVEAQWAVTEKTLDWYSGDREQLREAFWKFRQYSGEEIAAYTDILETFSAFIQIREMIQPTEKTDLQRLERYLDEHFTEKLSLEKISSALNIGRTKLCLLAKELSGGKTLSWLIAQRRVGAAKKLLVQGKLPISEVAEAVGISDYNYFTKVFRTAAGMTPSKFRKVARREKAR